ncbi:MAG: PAS domain S-box protein [Anaerolineae bacterium]|nr:PAS domain S-box protein [Anaerolineae bacterium]MCA9909803.1 PAS domain S-box protein [Anaerolineae bacterium]
MANSVERQQARTLAAIHFPLILVSGYLLLWPEHGFAKDWESSGFVSVALFLGLIITYTLSRTRHYKWSARGVIGLQIAYIFVFLLLQPDQNAVEMLPFLLSLPIFLSSIFLNIPMTIVVCVIAMGGLLAVPTLNSAVSVAVITNHLHYLGVLTPFILLVAYLRRQDQRKAEIQGQALAESHMRYQSLFEASFEPLIIHDNGIILDMNPAAETLSGYRLAEVRQMNLISFVRPELRESFQGAIKSDADLASSRFETELLRKDGSPFPAEIQAKRHHYQGRFVHVASIRDMTLQQESERKTVELVLARAQREVLQKLIRNFSHDVRTPLSVIKTSLYLIERSLTHPDRHRKHVEVVQTQVQKLQEIMDDVILLSKLDNAQLDEFEFAAVDLDLVLKRLVTESRAPTEARGVRLEYVGQPLKIPLHVDATALERILRNLIANAINFTPAGGSITISTLVRGADVRIIVCDTGVGIGEDDLPHIFEHFFRGDPVRNAETGSAGLGLTVAQKLVEVHQGQLLVESKLGEGSTFTVVLPFEHAKPVIASNGAHS